VSGIISCRIRKYGIFSGRTGKYRKNSARMEEYGIFISVFKNRIYINILIKSIEKWRSYKGI